MFFVRSNTNLPILSAMVAPRQDPVTPPIINIDTMEDHSRFREAELRWLSNLLIKLSLQNCLIT